MWLFGSKPCTEENYLRSASNASIQSKIIYLTNIYLGPNECRCIIRESLDYYRALVVGGFYEFSQPVDIKSIFTYEYALRKCIDRHPHLSITITNADTESPYYKFCPRLDLNQHVQFLDHDDKNEIKSIEQLLPTILDTKWPSDLPPWKITIIPFSQSRCFIGFSFSHGLGDGISGLAFHRTFLDSLQDQHQGNDLICLPSLKQLKPAFDTADNLPISWSFLLLPFLSVYLPKPIASIFGFHAPGSSNSGTWTGSPTFYNSEKNQTSVTILSINSDRVKRTLDICRTHEAKFTGLMHQLIITAISESLPQPNKFDNLAAQTAINMRNTVGISNDEMGLYVSGDFDLYQLEKPSSDSEFSWSLAKSITKSLAEQANKLQDQPIGLLRYLNDVRSWTISKLGQPRDCSYEISNLINFQPSGSIQRCSIDEMIFCQPTHITGAPLTFNIVSVLNGPMNITINWQVGALDQGSYNGEVEFVNKICQNINDNLSRLSSDHN